MDLTLQCERVLKVQNQSFHLFTLERQLHKDINQLQHIEKIKPLFQSLHQNSLSFSVKLTCNLNQANFTISSLNPIKALCVHLETIPWIMVKVKIKMKF